MPLMYVYPDNKQQLYRHTFANDSVILRQDAEQNNLFLRWLTRMDMFSYFVQQL